MPVVYLLIKRNVAGYVSPVKLLLVWFDMSFFLRIHIWTHIYYWTKSFHGLVNYIVLFVECYCQQISSVLNCCRSLQDPRTSDEWKRPKQADVCHTHSNKASFQLKAFILHNSLTTKSVMASVSKRSAMKFE